MTQITDQQFNTLRDEIYTVLMAGYDSEGEELGMGEMSNCHDAAGSIISDWMTKEGIELTN